MYFILLRYTHTVDVCMLEDSCFLSERFYSDMSLRKWETMLQVHMNIKTIKMNNLICHMISHKANTLSDEQNIQFPFCLQAATHYWYIFVLQKYLLGHYEPPLWDRGEMTNLFYCLVSFFTKYFYSLTATYIKLREVMSAIVETQTQKQARCIF